MVRIDMRKDADMLTYSLKTGNKVSLYQQLYSCIKQDICSGKLAANEKLPSKRALAKNMNISVITVEAAYEQLAAEGYITARPRSGFYCADIKGQIPVRQSQSDIEPRNEPSVKYDLVTSETLSDNFPFATWTRLMRRIISEEPQTIMQSVPAGGALRLRKAIARHLSGFSQMKVSPQQIIIGAGSEYLYGLLIQLLGRDKLFACETPGYTKPLRIYRAQDAEMVSIPMDSAGIRPDLLEDSHADILQISPCHHFPSGIVTPVGRRYELLAWLSARSGRFIIEDDFDSELRLSGNPIPPLFSMDVTGKVIYINTFTKTLASTIRISYMVLPESLLEAFHEKLGFYSCTVSNFEQYTLAAFIDEGFFEKHISRMRVYYRSLKNSLLHELQGAFGDKIEIKEEEAGLFFLLKFDTQLSDGQLKTRALENGVRLSFLSDYDSKTRKDSRTAVVCYGCLRPEDAPDLARRLLRAWS